MQTDDRLIIASKPPVITGIWPISEVEDQAITGRSVRRSAQRSYYGVDDRQHHFLH